MSATASNHGSDANACLLGLNGSGCIGTEHTFSQTGSFKALVMQTFAQAGGEPWIEGQPAPGTADAGADAGDDAGTTATDGGGCAVAPSSSASPLWLLALGLAVRRLRASAAKRARSA